MTRRALFTAADGCQIAYRIDGALDRPMLVLSNSIATSLEMWAGQIEALAEHHRVLQYDTRGHGASGAPAGAYSVERLGRDVLELLDSLEIRQVDFLGLSLGGMIGQWLGVHAPDRIGRLVLSNTAAYLGPPAQWDAAIERVLAAPDLSDFATMFLGNWFPAGLLAKEPAVAARFRSMVLATPPLGLAGCFAAVRDMDMRRAIALIRAPTLVITGRHDTVTLPRHGEEIARTVPGARLLELPVVHMPGIEAPQDFLNAVLDFLH